MVHFWDVWSYKNKTTFLYKECIYYKYLHNKYFWDFIYTFLWRISTNFRPLSKMRGIYHVSSLYSSWNIHRTYKFCLKVVVQFKANLLYPNTNISYILRPLLIIGMHPYQLAKAEINPFLSYTNYIHSFKYEPYLWHNNGYHRRRKEKSINYHHHPHRQS